MIPTLKHGTVVESTSSNRRYVVVRKLGQGGFGAAYQVDQVGPRGQKSKQWCLKVTDDAASWHREAYFGELLRGHDRAIQVEESFAISHRRRSGSAAQYYLVTEYAALGDLYDYLSRDN